MLKEKSMRLTSGGSTVGENSACHPEVKGLSPAVAWTWTDKNIVSPLCHEVMPVLDFTHALYIFIR
jgi:hypothetical protein